MRRPSLLSDPAIKIIFAGAKRWHVRAVTACCRRHDESINL